MQTQLTILLPTYNGEKYLTEQLDSLLAQSFQDFLIISRDDGSSDNTVAIVRSYKKAYPEKFFLIPSVGETLGASASFSYLMEYAIKNSDALTSTNAYLMFCDQDDIWLPEKIADQMQSMKQLELASSSDTPLLVHSDLCVVTEGGETIAESFTKYQGLTPARNSFSQMLLSNLVTGCTALINRKLAEIALPISRECIMHDWWLGLVAAAFGKIDFSRSVTVLYRQHGNNTIGAREHQQFKLKLSSIKEKLLNNKAEPLFSAVAIQANAFLQNYGHLMSGKDKFMAGLVKNLDTTNGWRQRINFRLLRLIHQLA